MLEQNQYQYIFDFRGQRTHVVLLLSEMEIYLNGVTK
jgi:hypothetical protein